MLTFFFLLAAKASSLSDQGKGPEIAALEQTLQEGILPSDGAPGNYGWLFAKMLLVLTVLVVLMGLTAWFLRRLIRHRFQKGGNVQSIQILERRVLSPKTMLYLIQVEDQKVLLAESHLEVKSLPVGTVSKVPSE